VIITGYLGTHKLFIRGILRWGSGTGCESVEVLRILAKLKRRLKAELTPECYKQALKVIKEFEAWIEEALAEQPPIP